MCGRLPIASIPAVVHCTTLQLDSGCSGADERHDRPPAAPHLSDGFQKFSQRVAVPRCPAGPQGSRRLGRRISQKDPARLQSRPAGPPSAIST